MTLPLRLDWNTAQDRWANILNPVANFTPVNGLILTSIPVKTGNNSINHMLGRNLQGWIPVRLRSSVSLYDTQDSNQMPSLTLQLVASADAVIDIWVF